MKSLIQYINESVINEAINLNSIIDKIKSLGADEKINFLYGVIFDYGEKTENFPETRELVSVLKSKRDGKYYCVADIVLDNIVEKALLNIAKNAPKEVNMKKANMFRSMTAFDETAIEYVLTNLPKEIQSLLGDSIFVKFVSLDPEECYEYAKKYVKEIKPVTFKEKIRDIDNQIRSLEKQIESLKDIKKKIEEIMK